MNRPTYDIHILLWMLACCVAVLALFGLLLLTGCAGKHCERTENALAIAQQIHWDVCLDWPPVIPEADCDRYYLKLRVVEMALERDDTARWIALHDLWAKADPYVRLMTERGIALLLAWIATGENK